MSALSPTPRARVSPVVVAVLCRRDLVLALARGFHADDVNLPSDVATPDEFAPALTLERMLFEKAGLHVVSYRLMSWWDESPTNGGRRLYAYFVTSWRGRVRSSSAGKMFWARPQDLVAPSCTFRERNRKLLAKLGRI